MLPSYKDFLKKKYLLLVEYLLRCIFGTFCVPIKINGEVVMEVVHFECGLGNQMLDYCDYLATQKANPLKDCYSETILFEIPECEKEISCWNGFELQYVFDIKLPNIKERFSDEEWKRIIDDVKRSEFWKFGWSYPNAITNAFANEGLFLENHCKSLYNYNNNKIRKSFDFLKKTRIWSKMLISKVNLEYKPIPEHLFKKYRNDVYCGHTLKFMYNGNNIEAIEDDIRKAFTFPEIKDKKNRQALDEIAKCNSVCVHIRRDDAMIGINRSIFYTNYYKRAVKLIKGKVTNPVFYIFGTNKTIDWAKNNLAFLGLDLHSDVIKYVDWNVGVDSFRDIHLMSNCKHNIISYSSFAWWGAFLNTNIDKITISPLKIINTTHHV